MAKMDIQTLFKELRKDLSLIGINADSWASFLRSAAWNYKYSFQNQVLIYSQRPDATACADFNVWNTKLHRYVARGSKGIAILNATGDKISYVFDVSDTRSQDANELKLWSVHNDNYSAVLSTLNSDHSFNCASIEDAIIGRIDENVVHAGSLYLPEGESKEDLEFIGAFNEFVKHSACFVALLRCGLSEAANAYFKEHIQNIPKQINTNDRFIALGVAVSSISEMVLREIELAVRVVEKSYTELNKEILEDDKNEIDIQTGRGVSGTGNYTNGAITGEGRENGLVKIEISSSQQADSLHNAINEWGTGKTSVENRGGSVTSNGADNTKSFKNKSGTLESGKSNGLDSTHEFASFDGRRSSEDRVDFSVDNTLFPTVEEQLEIIENDTDAFLHGFKLSQQDIDDVLVAGSHIVNGKFRIYDFFNEKHTAKEKAEFLKNEYGIGGAPAYFSDGVEGDTSHDGSGIKISKYQDMFNPDIKLKWNSAQKRIGELIKAGCYLNEKEFAEYPKYKANLELRIARSEIANKYISLVQDYNDFLEENNNTDALLNRYVLVDCGFCFIDGRSKTASLSAEGDSILPLMRDSLEEIISVDSPFKALAGEVLSMLKTESIKSLGFDLDDIEKESDDDFVSVPVYKVGDIVFNGATKYSIVEMSDRFVYLSDVEFELNSLELSTKDFERIVLENPSNKHLVQKVSAENYAEQNKKVAVILTEVETELKRTNKDSYDVIDLIRAGDFYEVRGSEARRVAEILNINLTHKTIDGNVVDLCGFPIKNLDTYNERLSKQGVVLRAALELETASDSIDISNHSELLSDDKIKRNSLVAKNYDALNRLAPGILNGDYNYLRFESEGLEPLTIENIGDNFFSIMHTFVQQGDLMRDPYVVVQVNLKDKTVTAASYEMSAVGAYKEYIDFATGEVLDVAGQKSTNSFLLEWFKNIERQGYSLVRGTTRDDVDVYFDNNGREISQETFEGLKVKFQVRLYRPYDAPNTVKAYVSPVNAVLEAGHVIDEERETFDFREAAENSVENFNSIFEFDEDFRNKALECVPAPIVHRYYSTQRPIGPGTFPKIDGNEPVNIINFDDREFQEDINRSAWGYLEFGRALTEKQVEDYELVKAPVVILTDGYSAPVTEEKNKIAVRIQLDGNDDNGIFVYIEHKDIPCPDNHIEIGVFDTESSALNFCSHIDNLLETDVDFREKSLAKLQEKNVVSLENEIKLLKPVVYCEWSEHNGFEDDTVYSFVEFNSLMKKLDDEVVKLKEEHRAKDDYYPYFKTKFVIRFPDGYEYEGRQDIGDGDGFLLDHVRKMSEYNLKRINENGYDGLYKGEERVAAIKGLETFLSVYLPLLESEIKDFEQSYNKNVYKIGYGSLGNGTTVWNSADIDKETNDYRIIAHISDDGTVKFYTNDLPEGVKAEIRARALDFSASFLTDVVNMSEEKFKQWYFNQILSHYPSYVPGKDFKMSDYVRCYNNLHSEEFVRDVSVPLIAQLDSLSKGILTDASNETRKEIIEKINQGEISNEEINSVLNELNATKIADINDVYEALANRLDDDVTISDFLEKKSDFKISTLELGVGGPKERFRNNIAAIKLLNQLESEGRQATPSEQEILSKYVGWGGLDQAFEVNNSSWAKEYNELLELMTPEEYRSAKASTLSAFYTPPVVINAIYEGLRNLGFEKGNILEPSCGVGNFFGMLPKEFEDSNLYGVELDSISGRIAKQLYPSAKIAVKGYEETKFKDGFFDVAIGNVPFGQFKVNDKEYNRYNFLIHDYFFAKTLDKVRPGGIVAFITSKGTLDKQSPEVRKYIGQRAELLGAIRLPNNTFSAAAGTKATSDIIFLKKRDKAIDIEPEWVHLGLTEEGLPINSYFVEHPEMILGHMEMERMQYGREDTTCVPVLGVSLDEQLKTAIKNITGKISEKSVDFDEALEDSSTDFIKSIPANPEVRNFSYTVVDGDIYYRIDHEMIKQELNSTREQRVKGLIEIRDSLRRLIDLQRYDYSDYEIETEQRRLNKLYDEYTSKYGLINSRGNSIAFEDDSSYYLLCSLENVNEKGELISKADMFTKRTIKRHVPVTSVGTPSEALAVCISEKARVDLDYMADLADMTKDKIVEELQGVIYRVPGEVDSTGEEVFVTADEYLSGNVREKLKVARLAAESDSRFDINVMALQQVIPKDLEPQEISVRLGSVWIPEDVVNEFMWQLLDTPKGYNSNEPNVKAHYNEINGSWTVENKNWYNYGVKASSTYGTKRISAYEIIFNTLNLKTVEIYDYSYEDGKQKRTLNKNETIVAQQKQELIKNEFLNWIWRDPKRRQRLVRIYNDKFNNIKLREYNGDHLVFEGMNPDITLMEHQKNAVAHAIYGGNTLLAHEVGAGKTFEMTAIAMESKRLGLCSKSLMVVPNHLIGQWASEFYQLYPSANLLVASKKDFEPANRKKFCSRIATGDYDAVIIGHSQFEKIPLSVELQAQFVRDEIDEIEQGILELQAAGEDRTSVKSLEKTKKSLELRLEKLNDIEQDDVITFEELGVDKIFIDEAHYFKNLFLYTKMRNVAGISQTEAKKSSDLYMKTRYLNDVTGSKGVVFATGTPISNSMVELFTLQRYLQPYVLKQNGLFHFDAWASTFGEVVTAVELSPEGTGYRAKTRFAKFYNIPELMTLFKLVADIMTGDDLDLPKPEAEFHVVQSEPSAFQEQIVESLGERAKAVRDRKVEPNEDNMLKITNDGRLLGLDQRCFDPSLPDDENSKVNKAVENIFDIWEEYKEDKLAQLVFCDLSTPKGNGEFSVYEDVKQKLIAKGIPEEEIVFIHDAKTDVQKDKLFAKVRSGEVRVLIGSTFKMGAGTNVQDKLIALHDLDCPWRPSDLEQRLGRILRQGNQQEKVQVFRYVTKGTFDAYLWQLVETKQKFISQIMTSKSPVRSADDVDDAALSYAEIKSLCIKDPRIKEKMELDVDIAKLKLVRANFMSQKYRMEDDIAIRYPSSIKRLEQSIVGYKADIKQVTDLPAPSEETAILPMVINGTTYTDRKEASKALLVACQNLKDASKVEIGEYCGFKMLVRYNPFTCGWVLNLKGGLSHEVLLAKNGAGNISRINNALSVETLNEKLLDCEQELRAVQSELATAKIEVKKEFAQQSELDSKIARLTELEALLRTDDKIDVNEDRKVDSVDGLIEKAKARTFDGNGNRDHTNPYIK